MSDTEVREDSGDLLAFLQEAEDEADGESRTWGQLRDRAEELRQAGNGRVEAEGAKAGEEAPSSKPAAPRKLTDDERAQLEEAKSRLALFDPGDAETLTSYLDLERYEPTAEEVEDFTLRLALMKERGEFVATLDAQLQEEIAGGDRELAYLSEELDKASSRRERDRLQEAHTSLAMRIPRIKDELKAREFDRALEAQFRKQADEQTREAIMETRRAALREAAGELTGPEILAGKEPPRKASPARIEALRWELEQPLDEQEVELKAAKALEQLRKESRARWASKFKEYNVKDDAEAWRHRVEIHHPGRS